jgi:hypothetical protein
MNPTVNTQDDTIIKHVWTILRMKDEDLRRGRDAVTSGREGSEINS